MKKLLIAWFLIAGSAIPADESPASPSRLPVPTRPSAPAVYTRILPQADETPRFIACENYGGGGFFWLNTTNGDLWLLEAPDRGWIYAGTPRGANSSKKGTYTLLSDRLGGVYILNTEDGEAWWTDGSIWKRIGDPSRRK